VILLLSLRDTAAVTMSAERPFTVEHAKSNRSTCKDTKEKIPKDALRITRYLPPRDEDSEAMSANYSLVGFTNMLAKARVVKVEDPDEINGFGALNEEEQEQVRAAVHGVEAAKERIKNERTAARKAKSKVKAEAGAGDDDEDGSGGSAKKKTKASKKEPAEAVTPPKKKVKKEQERPQLNTTSLPVPVEGQKYQPKEIATMLLQQCRAVPDMNRMLPQDDAAARTKLSGFIM
jgi:hypothetical protein